MAYIKELDFREEAVKKVRE